MRIPFGRRADDPPEQGLRFRLRVAAAQHPVGVAMTVAVLIASVPLIFVLRQQGDIKAAANASQKAAAVSTENAQQLKLVVNRIQVERKGTVGAFCSALNSVARNGNKRNDAIRALILGGAQGSVIFEPIYQQYHGPPYKVRLEQAKRAAAGLKKDENPILDCAAIQRQIEEVITPPTVAAEVARGLHVAR